MKMRLNQKVHFIYKKKIQKRLAVYHVGKTIHSEHSVVIHSISLQVSYEIAAFILIVGCSEHMSHPA